MSQAQRKPILPDPICLKCSKQMQLVNRAPFRDVVEIEEQTFRCVECGHVEDWIQSIRTAA